MAAARKRPAPRAAKKTSAKKSTAKKSPAKRSTKAALKKKRPTVRSARQTVDSIAADAPHVARASAYASAIAAGELVAGRWTRLAANRFLNDLDRAREIDFPYRLEAEAAERFCRFAEQLKHFKGPAAGQPFRLEDWQCFIAVNLFGWLRKDNGRRRFVRLYLEIARKNGKSFFLAVIGIYLVCADAEAGAEVYSAATTRDQAKIVFKAAQEILKRAPQLRVALGVDVPAHSIVQPSTASSFLALSSEDQTLDGLNPHGAVVDELHAHRTRGVWDVIETAIGARSQPLLAAITTAGSDRTGICYEVRNDLCKILEGAATDETFFGVVYTIDDEDDWRDESVWAKANPNLGISVNLELLRTTARKAERTPAAQAAFKTKHLNVWVGANAALYSIDAWNACADPTLDKSAFEGERAVVGLDLATRNDLVSRADVFQRRERDGRDHYYVFSRHYLPQGAIDLSKVAMYRTWAETGWLTVAGEETVDQETVKEHILEDHQTFELSEICIDNWNSLKLGQELAAAGATVVELQPSPKTFSGPAKWVQDLIAERRIHHNGDPVLAWAVGNVVSRPDPVKGNVYPRKELPENKIDPFIAMLMAMNRWERLELDSDSVYDQRGILTA